MIYETVFVIMFSFMLFSFKVLDLADIVGSVGGALGLFLGFSFLAATKAITNWHR